MLNRGFTVNCSSREPPRISDMTVRRSSIMGRSGCVVRCRSRCAISVTGATHDMRSREPQDESLSDQDSHVPEIVFAPNRIDKTETMLRCDRVERFMSSHALEADYRSLSSAQNRRLFSDGVQNAHHQLDVSHHKYPRKIYARPPNRLS